MRQVFDQLLYDYALKWVGVPYIYGGNGYAGVDCSGLVLNILHTGGIELADMTAHQLSEHFYKVGAVNVWGFGALAFFGKSLSKVSHTGFLLDERRMIHAAGGDSKTTTLMEAERRAAFVRVSPVRYRQDFLFVVMPVYPHRPLQ